MSKVKRKLKNIVRNIMLSETFANTNLVKNMRKNLYIVGDFQKDIADYKTYSHKVSVISAMMAGIVLERGGYFEKEN